MEQQEIAFYEEETERIKETLKSFMDIQINKNNNKHLFLCSEISSVWQLFNYAHKNNILFTRISTCQAPKDICLGS